MEQGPVLVAMLRQLLKEMEIVTSQGAGYYTCAPFAQRYNKLLKQARSFLPGSGVIESFDNLGEEDPKDPADKSKALLGVRIEITQLVTLLETVGKEDES
jgi:hypothetical protein